MGPTSPTADIKPARKTAGDCARNSDAGYWSCPRCHRVVRGLFEVEFASWLALIGPVLRCAGCVDELRASGPGDVWDLRLLRHLGAPLAPCPTVLA